jgi:hypothetical protein
MFWLSPIRLQHSQENLIWWDGHLKFTESMDIPVENRVNKTLLFFLSRKHPQENDCNPWRNTAVSTFTKWNALCWTTWFAMYIGKN